MPPINRATAEGFVPILSWIPGPRNPDENWLYVRRCEVANLAIPFAVALLLDGDMAPASDEWRGSAANRDREVVERAARLAAMLQEAVDEVRPRS